MNELDPGHTYGLDVYSRMPEARAYGTLPLSFMKRVGDRYPGNTGSGYNGTNCQEVLRALIKRVLYLNNQIPCSETEAVVGHLRSSLLLFEIRAAREHGLEFTLDEFVIPATLDGIEDVTTCRRCGHIKCGHGA